MQQPGPQRYGKQQRRDADRGLRGHKNGERERAGAARPGPIMRQTASACASAKASTA